MLRAINDAKHIQSYVLKMRKYFHQNPELSGMEEKTSLRIIAELKAMKVEYEVVDNYSVVAFINRGKGYKNLAFRVNMDALPIEEVGSYPAKSKITNVSHMSGHDADMAILLGVIKNLKRREKELSGEVIFIFESSNLSFNGARDILKNNVLKNIDYIFGVHDFPLVNTGSLVIGDGLFLLGSDSIEIKWFGEPAPVPFSYEAKDPIMAAANFTSNIRTIVSSNIDASDIAIVTVTEFMSGGFHNIIADYCEMMVNIRYRNDESRKKIHALITEYVRNLEKQFNVKAEITVSASVRPTVNDQDAYQLAYNSAIKIVKSEKVIDKNPILNCDSLGTYLDKYKGAMISFGSKNMDDVTSRNFSNTYNPNEDSFQYATAWCIQIVLDYLRKK